ncbi:hypothetical protein BH24CHL7_BH24CHL7_10520 [soil metagenome]
MPTNRQLDETISRWLETEAPRQVPNRVLRSTFERTRKTGQPGGWRALLGRLHVNRMMSALGGVTAVVVVALLVLGLYASNQGGIGAPPPAATPPAATPPAATPPAAAFDGNWEATDDPPDNSHLTMAIVAQANGTYDITMRDDVASVCGGASSTLTGVARTAEPDTIVIEQPEYTCDDGSEAESLSPPLEDQLRDLSFTYDFQSDAVHGSLIGLLWSRVAEAPDGSPAPSATEEPSATEPTSGQPAAFAGSWEATDSPPDSSHLTMTIDAQPDGTFELTIRDDGASVCGGAPSTMTGVAEAGEPGTIAIEQPEYACDDGSEAQALSGPPLLEQLRDLGFTYDSQRDELEDSLGLVWRRE